MEESQLIETRIDGELVYDGSLMKVFRERVRLPNGAISVREFTRHPGACVVIPEVCPGVFIFERQYRYPLGQVFIEFPAGKIDPGESLLACAKRELLEETGYSATSWKHLGATHNCIGYSDEKIEIFHASGLQQGAADPDDGEFVEIFEMTADEAENAVFNGLITDAKTIACLFWLRSATQKNRS